MPHPAKTVAGPHNEMLGATLRRFIGDAALVSDTFYAGDMSPWQAWDKLADDPEAVLVDVRTEPEWQFVGRPDLRPLGREAIFVAWQLFPDMRRNPAFLDQLDRSGVRRDQPVLLLCRSGQRSRAAAAELASLGFTAAYNITDGFEGPRNESGHRGETAGWKALDLPWVQN